MANPLAKLFVEITAKGQEAVDRALGRTTKGLKEVEQQAEKTEKAVGGVTSKLEQFASGAEKLVGRLTATVGLMAAAAAAGLGLANVINKVRDAFRNGADDVEKYRESLTGRENPADEFEQIRDRVEEISELIGRNRTSFGTLFAAGRSKTSLEQEKRELEVELRKIGQLRQAQRNRDKRAAQEAAEEEARVAAEAQAKADAEEAARQEELRRKAVVDAENAITQELEKRLEAERKVAAERERLAELQAEQDRQRVQDLAKAQIDSATQVINAISQLQGNQAQGINQLLRKFDDLIQATRNGGR